MDRISEPQHTGNVAAALTTCERPHMAYIDVTTDLEIWKPVVGYEGLYEVSSLGRVRSLDRVVPHSNRWGSSGVRRCAGTVLKLNRKKDGRMQCLLHGHSGVLYAIVAVLVAEAFIGPRPSSTYCCHNDGDPANNVPANLRWDTPSANARDKELHGTAQRGSRSGMAKLDEAKVRALREAAACGAKQSELAKQYGIHNGTVWMIVNRRTWSHVA